MNKLRLRAAGLMDTRRKRPQNEDAFLCDVETGLFIVADGIGGKNAGELASKAVVTVLPALLRPTLASSRPPKPGAIQSALTQSLRQLSHDLYEKSKLVGALAGLGSTAVVLAVRHGVAYLAYAGDSRAYLLRGQKLVQLTVDQTTAAALVRAGHLTPEAAEQSPLRHSLEEYVGKRSKLEPGVRCRKMQRRDRWLLCSDGVTKGLSDAAICDVLQKSPDVETACRELVRAANEADGSDNITALVIESA